MNVRLTNLPSPSPRRNPQRRRDTSKPLHDHQRGKQAIGTPVNRLLVILKENFRGFLHRGIHSGAFSSGENGSNNGQPNTGVPGNSPRPSVKNRRIATRPGLSPSWPRASVTPPL